MSVSVTDMLSQMFRASYELVTLLFQFQNSLSHFDGLLCLIPLSKTS